MPEMAGFNNRSHCRVTVEWGFKDMADMWAFVSMKLQQKFLQSPVGVQYRVGTLLPNWQLESRQPDFAVLKVHCRRYSKSNLKCRTRILLHIRWTLTIKFRCGPLHVLITDICSEYLITAERPFLVQCNHLLLIEAGVAYSGSLAPIFICK